MTNASEHIPEATDYKTLTEVARARYKLACDEMDRLTAGNPGTNWRWSIPANPARDSDLILSASAEDVPRLADAVESLLGIEQRLTDHIVQLAAERDALQSRLDSMTTETRWRRLAVDGRGHIILQMVEEQRLVGPWVVVARSVGSGVQQDGAASDRPAGAASEDPDSPSSPAGHHTNEEDQ